MSLTISSSEPLTFRAGDTVNWNKLLYNFPTSEGWALSYLFINSSGKIDIPAVISGALYNISIPAATTAKYSHGEYTWYSAVTLNGARHSVDSGKVKIQPDLAAVTSAGYDLRSNARKTLDALEAALATHGDHQAWTQSYTIAGRSMTFKSVVDFFKFHARMVVKVRAEEAADRISNGQAPQNKIRVRF